ncbi:hypothetical protein [Trueperella sp. LYQ143]|uniref:hypothetical protein n=1 Tax=Trueperella sp. LYQ143 TaxID=3391059 RepID=UPI0039839262
MTTIIIAMLTAIVGGAFASGAEALYSSIDQYNANAYAFVTNVNSIAVKPIAATLLSAILLLELLRIVSRYEESQAATPAVVAFTFKAVVVISIVQKSDLILAAINDIGHTLISGVQEQSPAANIQELTPTVIEAVEDMSLTDQVAVMFILFLPYMMSLLGHFALKIIVFLYFAEIYILSAAATLPLVFFGHVETKHIAIGFLKRYASAVMHGVTIVLVLAVYSFFQFDSLNLSASTGDTLLHDIVSNIGVILFGPAFFLFILFASSRLSKAFLGEG